MSGDFKSPRMSGDYKSPRMGGGSMSAAGNRLADAVSGGALAAWSRAAPVAGPLLIALMLAAILAFQALRPHFNWDMIPYLAAALHSDGQDFGPVHAAVYDAVREAAPPSVFKALAEGDAYRLRQFTDPAALQSMLGMYEVKWLYVALLGLAVPVFGMAAAGLAINAAAAALLAVSLWAWMSRHRLQLFAPLVAALFLGLGLPDMMRVTSPDLLTTALLASGLMLWDRGRTAGALLPLTLAVLARPDTAIFLGGLCVLLALLRPQDAFRAGLTLALAAAAYLFATSAGHHSGWWSHVWFSTYRIQETLEGFAPAFSLKVYLTAIGFNAGRSLVEFSWPGFWLAGLVALFVALHLRRLDAEAGRAADLDFRIILLAAAVIATAGKFVLFPLPENRLYAPHLFPALVLAGGWFAARFAAPLAAPWR